MSNSGAKSAALGWLVAFEGIDGSGKSSQASDLAARLRRHGLSVLCTREPTNGRWGQKIRQSAQSGRLSPQAELEAFLEDRREHLELEIRPALARGDVVVIDRYVLSTVAYQGARGFDPHELLRLNEFARQPDLCFILDLPPELGLSRVKGRGAGVDLFEKEDELRAARRIFVDPQIAGAAARRFRILNADAPRDALAQQINETVRAELGLERLD